MEAQDDTFFFLSTRYIANATTTTDTEVKHKRQASVSRTKQSALILKTLLKKKIITPTPAVRYNLANNT